MVPAVHHAPQFRVCSRINRGGAGCSPRPSDCNITDDVPIRSALRSATRDDTEDQTTTLREGRRRTQHASSTATSDFNSISPSLYFLSLNFIFWVLFSPFSWLFSCSCSSSFFFLLLKTFLRVVLLCFVLRDQRLQYTTYRCLRSGRSVDGRWGQVQASQRHAPSAVDRGSGWQPRQPSRSIIALLQAAHRHHSSPAKVSEPRDESSQDGGCDRRALTGV